MSASQPYMPPDDAEFDPLALPVSGPGKHPNAGFASSDQHFELLATPDVRSAPPVAAQQTSEANAKSGQPEWQQKIRQQDRRSGFGALEQSTLIFGIFSVVLGLVLNILPLAGIQFARFEGVGVVGQLIGLFIGLLGVALLSFSLRRFKLASRIGGAGISAFVFIVFLISVSAEFNKREIAGGGENLTTPVIESPWIGLYPSWLGVDKEAVPAPSDDPDPADESETALTPEVPDVLPLPNTELNEDQLARDIEMRNLAEKLRNSMRDSFGADIQTRFPDEFLSQMAGETAGDLEYLAHPSKLPMVGVDLLVKTDRQGAAVVNMVPVFDINDAHEKTIRARDGYAIAGLNVNADRVVHGIQFVFMAITPKGFDTSRTYISPWYGRPPSSGKGTPLVGDGPPVYGLWMARGKYVTGIGLIRERY